MDQPDVVEAELRWKTFRLS